MRSLIFPIGLFQLLVTLLVYAGAVVVGGFLFGFAFRRGWDAAGPRPPAGSS
jgi:hypothetical protein